MEKIKIAFLAACPSDFPRAGVEAEYRYIEAELDRSDLRDRFDCRFVPAVTRAELLRQLTRLRPHIVHFGGHGTNRDELMFENEQGRAEPVSAADLELVFSTVPVADRPRIVVFSACYSVGQAQAVTRVVDCAIGMSREIRDSAARAFAQGFYQGLAQGLTVRTAVDRGRVSMPAGGASAQLPELHTRADADLDQPLLARVGPVSRYPTDLHIDRNEELVLFGRMLDAGDPKLLLVTAGGAMGKSELLGTMARLSAEHHYASIDLTKGVANPEGALAKTVRQLRLQPLIQAAEPIGTGATVSPLSVDPRLSATRQADLERQTREFVNAAEDLVRGTHKRVVLLLDGFDSADGELAVWIEDHLLPEIIAAERIVAVVAGRRKPRVDTGRHLVREEMLGNFRKEDVRAALEMLRLDRSESAVNITWVLAEQGNPYQTALQLNVLWRHAVESGA